MPIDFLEDRPLPDPLSLSETARTMLTIKDKATEYVHSLAIPLSWHTDRDIAPTLSYQLASASYVPPVPRVNTSQS